MASGRNLLTACRHCLTIFVVTVDLNRVKNVGRFLATVRFCCGQCGHPFRFAGLPYGYDLNGAAVSEDGSEARLALVPQGEPLVLVEDWRGGQLDYEGK